MTLFIICVHLSHILLFVVSSLHISHFIIFTSFYALPENYERYNYDQSCKHSPESRRCSCSFSRFSLGFFKHDIKKYGALSRRTIFLTQVVYFGNPSAALFFIIWASMPFAASTMSVSTAIFPPVIPSRSTVRSFTRRGAPATGGRGATWV